MVKCFFLNITVVLIKKPAVEEENNFKYKYKEIPDLIYLFMFVLIQNLN